MQVLSGKDELYCSLCPVPSIGMQGGGFQEDELYSFMCPVPLGINCTVVPLYRHAGFYGEGGDESYCSMQGFGDELYCSICPILHRYAGFYWEGNRIVLYPKFLGMYGFMGE